MATIHIFRTLFSGAVCTILAVLGPVNIACGAFIQDQVGATVHNGGIGYAVQSFTPAQDNIAGIDVWVGGTAGLTADVTASVWESSAWNGSAFSGTAILTSVVNDVAGNSAAELRFDPFALTPEQTYMIEFFSNDVFPYRVLISGTDPYTRGEEQTFSTTGFIDVRFGTFYDDAFTAVPVPAAVWLFGSALGLLGWMRRKAA